MALAATTTIMVALAFLIPLAVLVRTLARDRALSAAEIQTRYAGMAPGNRTSVGGVRPSGLSWMDLRPTKMYEGYAISMRAM